MSIGESIVYSRLEEVCPPQNTHEMSDDELVRACNVAFQIIGYNPNNLQDSVSKILERDEYPPLLFEFVFEVWKND